METNEQYQEASPQWEQTSDTTASIDASNDYNTAPTPLSTKEEITEVVSPSEDSENIIERSYKNLATSVVQSKHLITELKNRVQQYEKLIAQKKHELSQLGFDTNNPLNEAAVLQDISYTIANTHYDALFKQINTIKISASNQSLQNIPNTIQELREVLNTIETKAVQPALIAELNRLYQEQAIAKQNSEHAENRFRAVIELFSV